MTWNNFDGAYSSTLEATFPAGTTTPADLTSLVQEWVLGFPANDGILLERDLGSMVFASSDCPENLRNLRPQLEVCFVPLPLPL